MTEQFTKFMKNSLPRRALWLIGNLAKRLLNTAVREIERGANQRVTKKMVTRVVVAAGLDIDSLELLPRDQTVAFVWCVTLSDGTRLAAKAVGWLPLARSVDRRKPTELFDQVDLRERLTFEAERLAKLHEFGGGPRVLASTDHVILMDWVEGLPFRQALSDQPQTLDAVIDFVATLHGKGFHHGDLHAGNVLVGPDGSVVLLDPSFRFKDAIGENKRALFDYALLLGSVVAGAGGGADTGAIVREAIDHLGATLGADTVASMSEFARSNSRENRYLAALLSLEQGVDR